MVIRTICGLIILLLTSSHSVFAQDPTRFESEIEAIQQRGFTKDSEKPLAVFTGSSSIRMWEDLESSYPDYQVLNNGFGGSEFSDLIYYKEELIFSFSPQYIFIYEGDNDVNSGKIPSNIAEEANNLILEIKERLPRAKIFLISPKPSISRWHLRDRYLTTNLLLNRVSELHFSTYFIDVWTPMLNENGNIRSDLFIEDDLHMNAKGYAIWYDIIGYYLN